jgi:YVTN family beta-propeller protein
MSLACAGNARAAQCENNEYPFPYSDVAGVPFAFCFGILQSYVMGITRGTTPTTFTPDADVTRLQMTTFLQRSMDQSLKRTSRRMALGQWWTPSYSPDHLQRVTLPVAPGMNPPGLIGHCRADGERIWVASGNRLNSVQASTGEVMANAFFGPAIADLHDVLVAHGRVFMAGPVAQFIVPIRPKWAEPFTETSQGSFVPYRPAKLAFDGRMLWTANTLDNSISRLVMFNGTLTFANTLTGFIEPTDVAYDGSYIWVAEAGGANRLRKLDTNGMPLQTVAVGVNPTSITYDGANLWVTNADSNSITVISAASGTVIATIASNISNALMQPAHAAFDGERILVVNRGNEAVTLFRAADLALIDWVSTGAGSQPYGACSDGINFWVTLRGTRELLRF